MSNKIAEQCGAAAAAAQDAITWVNDPANAEKIGEDAARSKTRALRRAAQRARKLARAAERPMCVSVFGPSQAGKSFLVSVLARPKGGKLLSDFPSPDGRLDFISEINPEGEGESTGIVTRFTIRTYEAPEGFPVKLRLLNESDIARILANTFLMDGDKSEPEPTGEEIDELIRTFSARMQDQPQGGLSADDVAEIQEYLAGGFSRSTYIRDLTPFWEEAMRIAPRLSVEDRAAFLAPLWGRHEAFTKLYARLARALAALDHSEEAFAPLEALRPRKSSIIDVKLLNGLDREDGPALKLSNGAKTAELPRAVITALTAELVLPMAEKPHDLFENTDLLDFPGARTRFEKELSTYLNEADEPLKECMLRGKVAYLFDRYVAEQEITAMLLCIPDSNMEVANLPALVADWVAHTHGADPAKRAAMETLLFFVLTKFDKHLSDSAGSDMEDAGSRFDLRMNASLLEKFAPTSESWPVSWAGDQPFSNCFWLRNPNFPARSVISYDGELTETGYLDEMQGRIDAWRDGCVNAALVKRHFKDPQAAWDAAMALNDGGVTYLIDNLTPVCRPEMKNRQIAQQLAETTARIIGAVSEYHVSDDLSKRLEERREAAVKLMQDVATAHQHRLFGEILETLMVSHEAIFNRMKRPPETVKLVAAGARRGAAQSPAGASNLSLPGGLSLPAALPSAPAAPKPVQRKGPSVRTLSRAEWRAEAAFSVWSDRLRSFAAQDDLALRFQISAESANEMAGELISAARRLEVREKLTAELDELSHLERGDGEMTCAAVLAAERLNAFTSTSGAVLIPEENRPEVPQGETAKPAFAAPPQTDGPDGLPEAPLRADDLYVSDWLHMIYYLFEENAKDVDGSVADPEQNERLGEILKRLNAA